MMVCFQTIYTVGALSDPCSGLGLRSFPNPVILQSLSESIVQLDKNAK